MKKVNIESLRNRMKDYYFKAESPDGTVTILTDIPSDKEPSSNQRVKPTI